MVVLQESEILTQPEYNPNIGILGKAEFQERSHRVKGFCPVVVNDQSVYWDYVNREIAPKVKDTGASRVIDRAVVKDGTGIQEVLDSFGLTTEANVRLGGRWEGYSWVMNGRNFEGRIFSPPTQGQLRSLVFNASNFRFETVRQLTEGYSLESIAGVDLSDYDIESLVDIFKKAFIEYITPMDDPSYVKSWTKDKSCRPHVIRNLEGRIVSVASADLGEITFTDGRIFKFMEIGDCATNPGHRANGLNRVIKSHLICEGLELGYDCIHTEARACVNDQNIGDAKNGMVFYGTLPSNCRIRGKEDVRESSDPDLADWARSFGSLNVWALTPIHADWGRYVR